MAVNREPAAGHNAVHMGMMGQRQPPGVQDQRDADVGTQMLRVGGDRAQRLRGDGEQQVVDQRLVGIGDGRDRRRQGEHHVVVLDRQEVGLARLQPLPAGTRVRFATDIVSPSCAPSLSLGT